MKLQDKSVSCIVFLIDRFIIGYKVGYVYYYQGTINDTATTNFQPKLVIKLANYYQLATSF